MLSKAGKVGTLMIAGLLACPAQAAATVGTAFTYQGELYDADAPVTGACDLEFTLWDDPAAGMQIGGVVAQTLDVEAGKFLALLDFGPGAFTGDARWLQIDVCCTSPCSPALTPLVPRQELTPVPYAMHADSGGAADGHSLDASDGDPVDAVFVDANGQVGIGTTTPDRALHIRSGGIIRLDRDTDSPGVMLVRTAPGDFNTVWKAFSFAARASASGVGEFVIKDKGTVPSNSGTPRLTIDTDGNVGIGTEAPTDMLDVAVNIRAGGTITSGNSITIDGVNDTITASGGVIGFGADALQTSGLIESTGAGFRFPDGTTQTTAATTPTFINADALNGYTAEELLDLAAAGVVLSPQYLSLASLQFTGLTMGTTGYSLHGPSISVATDVVETLGGGGMIIEKNPGPTHYGNVTIRQTVTVGTVSPLMGWYSDIVSGQVYKRDGDLRIQTSYGGDFWVHLVQAWPARATQEYIGETGATGQAVAAAAVPPQALLQETFEFAVEGITFSGTERADPPTVWATAELVGVGTALVAEGMPFSASMQINETLDLQTNIIHKNPGRAFTDDLRLGGILPTSFLTLLWPQHQDAFDGYVQKAAVVVRDTSTNANVLRNYHNCWVAETTGLHLTEGCPPTGCGHGNVQTVAIDDVRIVCESWTPPAP